MSGSSLRPTPRVLRVLVWSYALKTLLVVLVCLLAPELPTRVLDEARAAWTRVITATR